MKIQINITAKKMLQSPQSHPTDQGLEKNENHAVEFWRIVPYFFVRISYTVAN